MEKDYLIDSNGVLRHKSTHKRHIRETQEIIYIEEDKNTEDICEYSPDEEEFM